MPRGMRGLWALFTKLMQIKITNRDTGEIQYCEDNECNRKQISLFLKFKNFVIEFVEDTEKE